MNCSTFGPIDFLGWAAAIGTTLALLLGLIGVAWSGWQLCRAR